MNKLLLILLVAIAIACENKKAHNATAEIPKDQAIVKGQIDRYDLTDSIFEITFHWKDIVGDYEQEITPIDSLGNFEVTLTLPFQKNIGMWYNSWQNLILKGGEELKISFDGKDTVPKRIINSFKFEGPSAELNQNYFKYIANSPFDGSAYRKKMNSLDPDAFKKMHDSIFEIKTSYIKSFLATNEITEELKNWIEVDHHYFPAYQLLNYRMFREMAAYNNPDIAKIPHNFYSSIESLPNLKAGNLINKNLSDDFAPYYLYYISDKIKEDNIGLKNSQLDSILLKSLVKEDNRVLSQIIINNNLASDFENNQVAFYDQNHNMLDSLFTKSIFSKLHQTKVSEIKELLANPILPKKAKLLTFETLDPSKYLDEIINKANGKVIFIDSWATWCGPCKSEFKTGTPELKEKFGDQIEFVYLCYKSKEELWKPAIAQFKVEGKHYFIESGKEKELINQIQLQGYPTYTIINKQGEIVKTGFEFRPSQPATTEILEGLLTE